MPPDPPAPAAAPVDAIAVRGRQVVVAWGDQVALATSDFALPAGRVTALIGPNGSGKSTLLHAIARLVEPLRGSLEVHAPDPSRPPLAYVLQSTKVNEAMPVTVREVVMMGRYGRRGLLRPFRSDDREACRIALERLDIADLRDRHLDELSGGQRQRVFVAQGLVEDAQILLLDEPVTGLDLVSRDRIQQVIAEERDRGTTIVLTTHDLRDAWAADHVLLLAGRVVAGGPPGEVVTAERLSAAFGTEIVTVGPRSLLVDDAHHVTTAPRHVHFDRTGHHHGVPPSE